MAETGCTPEIAEELLRMLARVGLAGIHHLTTYELELLHPVLDVIIPDHTAAEPFSGTGHDLANRYCLGTSPYRQLWHTKIGPSPYQVCAVMMLVP
jgi:hypothetical protein